MREVGAQLRQLRLERGVDLDEVARQLRIKPAYLFGIEQGDLSALPGRAYALGFLRTYADYLGFDGAELIGRIKSSVGDLTDRTRLRIRAPVPENRLPRTPMVVISLAIVAGTYLGWSYVNRTSRVAVDTVAEVPEELRRAPAAAAPQERVASAAPRTPAAATGGAAGADVTAGRAGVAPRTPPEPDSADALAARSGASAPVSDEPSPRAAGAAPGQTTGQALPAAEGAADDRLARERAALALQPAAGAESSGVPAIGRANEPGLAATEDAAAAPPVAGDRAQAGGAARTDPAEPVDPARRAVALLLDAQGAPRVYERANTGARVILRAREPAWVQVSSPAGDYTFTRTLEPGEAVLVPNRSDLELWTGNAHGLEIIVDGTAMPALAGGPMVRRNISLDPDRLKGAAARPR